MRKFLLTLLALSPASTLACANKIDPSKVMLFVDTNNSELEIATTEKAACARGERLVIVPKNFKDYAQHTAPFEAARKKLEKCGDAKGPACASAKEEVLKTGKVLNDYVKKQPKIEDAVKEALDGIKATNGKLRNITISGHDGGGFFSGNKGNFSRNTLVDMMKNYSDINEVTGLMLLGCYTGTPKEVIAWKNMFPKVKLIGGYDASAPLADRPQGHQYLTDILLKEKELSALADEKKLQSYVNSNFKGLNNLYAGMYVECLDSNEGQYYGSGHNREFHPLSLKQCLEKKPMLTEISTKLEKYLSGELEPPSDTQRGELRTLYNKARAFEHCFQLANVNINMNSLFNLLFNEGVEQSFSQYFKKDLDEAERVLKTLTPEQIEKNMFEHLAKAQKDIELEESKVKKLQENPKEYFAERAAELNALEKKRDEFFNDPSYAKARKSLDAIYQGNSSNLSLDEVPRINQLMHAKTDYEELKSNIDAEKANPGEAIKKRQASLLSLRQSMKDTALAITEIKKPENQIWVPTSENLKKYSRKDLLQNVHRMNKLLTYSAVSGETNRVLSWTLAVASNHLVTHNNPFSWHEYTGKSPEDPTIPMRLKDYNESSYMYGLGQAQEMGGMTGGMMGGGGSIQPTR